MFRGVGTISYYAQDVPAAKAWYTEVLGIAPYFERPEGGPPEYVEFRIGDYGEGFVTASVVDPFGNILGIMTNPHYVEVLASARGE